MVFYVGIDPVWGKISVFNESTKEINDFVIDKVAPDDVHKINAMYEEIETKINGEEIGCVCIYLQQKYNNDIRIKFIEKGTKFGFTDIQIIDLLTLQFLQYIFQAQFKPNFGDVIWIFLDGKCYIWKKFEKKAKLIKFLEKVCFSTKEDLLKINKISEANKNPSLIILDSEYSKINENFLEDAFPKCKIFVGGKAWSCAKAALIKARIMASDSELMEYDADTVLINPMCVKINGKLIFQLTANAYQTLPFSQDFILPLKDGEKMLKIYVDETFYENIKLIPSMIQSKQCKITFYIDSDGIYSIECSSMEPLFSIRHHSTTDVEDFDDLESTFETENENVYDTTESGNSETETVKPENTERYGLNAAEEIIKNDQIESQQPEDVIKKLLESFGSEEIESGSETDDIDGENNVDTDFSPMNEGQLLHSKLSEVSFLRRNVAISPLPDKYFPLSQIFEASNLSFPEENVTEIIATRPPLPPKPKLIYVPNKEEVPNSRLNNAPRIRSLSSSENPNENKVKRPNDLNGLVTRELPFSWRSPSPPPIPKRFESLIDNFESSSSSLTKQNSNASE